MVVARIMYGGDNYSFMHDEYPFVCESCGYPIRTVINQNFTLKRKNLDVSYTYDGYLIVSERFKEFCIAQRYRSISFKKLPSESRFFWVNISKTILLDYEKREVKFINKCDKCGNFGEVIGSVPSFLNKDIKILNKSFYKSEYEFGSFERKGLLIILHNDLAKELDKQKFKGLYFDNVLQS